MKLLRLFIFESLLPDYAGRFDKPTSLIRTSARPRDSSWPRGRKMHGAFADERPFRKRKLIRSRAARSSRRDESTSAVIPCEFSPYYLRESLRRCLRVTRRWGTHACVPTAGRVMWRGMLKFMHAPATADVLRTTWISSYIASKRRLAESGWILECPVRVRRNRGPPGVRCTPCARLIGILLDDRSCKYDNGRWSETNLCPPRD
jgi:hypothetical protein